MHRFGEKSSETTVPHGSKLWFGLFVVVLVLAVFAVSQIRGPHP